MAQPREMQELGLTLHKALLDHHRLQNVPVAYIKLYYCYGESKDHIYRMVKERYSNI